MLSHKIGVNIFKKSYQGSFPIIIYETRSTTRRKKKLQNTHTHTHNTLTNMCRIKNMLLNSQWGTEEVKEEIRQYQETNENKNTMI